MNMYGDDWQYADSRLQGTIVRHDGKAVLVEGVGKKGAVISLLRADTEPKIVKLDDLDLSPVKLGFCNINMDVSYLTRMPMRRDWRQGLRKGNFVSVFGTIAELVPFPNLADTIENIYPSLEECLATPNNTFKAWCREWAIGKSSTKERPLYYKNTAVGSVINGKPELKGDNMLLREALQEVL